MRKLFGGLGFVILVACAVIIYRGLAFELDQGPLPPAETIELDDRALAERLAAVIRIPTVTQTEAPQLDPEVFGALRSYLRQTFPLAHTRLSTRTVAQHSLLFRWAGTDPSLKPALLMAHQDVVPIAAGTEGDWTHPPFAGVIADGFVWGRGAIDVKCGVVGILEAVEKHLSEDFAPKRTVYLAFGHDEEVGGVGAQTIAKLLADEGVELEYVLDEGGLIADGLVPDVADPVALVGIAEKGYTSLELTVKSAGGHASMPPKHTAAGIIAKAVAALEANPFPVHTDHSGVFLAHVGPRMPLLKRMIFANMWLFEPVVISIMTAKPSTAATLRTTTAVTMLKAGVKDNVLPQQASAVVNFRILPGDTPQSVLDRVREVIDDDRVTVKPYGGEDGASFGSAPSPVSDMNSPAFGWIKRSIRQVAADERLVVAPYLVVGATDSRYFTDLSPNVFRFLFNVMNPEDVSRFHGTNERIRVADYSNAVRFYYALIKNSAG